MLCFIALKKNDGANDITDEIYTVYGSSTGGYDYYDHLQLV